MNYITYIRVYCLTKKLTLIENPMDKKILIFSGDPNSINSEIIFKCWKNINNITKKKFT